MKQRLFPWHMAALIAILLLSHCCVRAAAQQSWATWSGNYQRTGQGIPSSSPMSSAAAPTLGWQLAAISSSGVYYLPRSVSAPAGENGLVHAPVDSALLALNSTTGNVVWAFACLFPTPVVVSGDGSVIIFAARQAPGSSCVSDSYVYSLSALTGAVITSVFQPCANVSTPALSSDGLTAYFTSTSSAAVTQFGFRNISLYSLQVNASNATRVWFSNVTVSGGAKMTLAPPVVSDSPAIAYFGVNQFTIAVRLNDGTLAFSRTSNGGGYISLMSTPWNATAARLYTLGIAGFADAFMNVLNPLTGSPSANFVPVGGEIVCPVAISSAGDTVYAASTNGCLYALTHNGTGNVTQQWKFCSNVTTNGEVPPTLADDGTILFAARQTLFRVATTGEMLWKYAFPLAEDIVSAPVHSGDTMYLSTTLRVVTLIRPSPSPTPSITFTNSATPTATLSIGASPSATASETASTTPTATRTSSVTMNATRSFTGSPSVTHSPTVSPSGTRLPSVSPFGTRLPSVSPSGSRSPTLSRSGTRSTTPLPAGTRTSSPAPTTVVAAVAWTTWGGNYQRTGQAYTLTLQTITNNVTIRWEQPANSSIGNYLPRSLSVITQGLVFASTDAGLLAIDAAAGQVVWSFPCMFPTPVVVSGDSNAIVFAARQASTNTCGSDGVVHTLNAQTGAVLTTVVRPCTAFSTPTLGGDQMTAFFTSTTVGDAHSTTFNISLWSLRMDVLAASVMWTSINATNRTDPLTMGPPVISVSTAIIYFGVNQYSFAVWVTNGTLAWSRSLYGGGCMSLMVASSFSPYNALYALHQRTSPFGGFGVVSLNASTGAVLSTSVPGLSSNAANSVVISASKDRLYTVSAGCLYALGNDLSYKWQFCSGLDPPNDVGPSVAGDGTIFFAAQQTLFRLSATSGLLWKFEFPPSESIVSAPVQSSDGSLYLSTTQRIVALMRASATPTPSVNVTRSTTPSGNATRTPTPSTTATRTPTATATLSTGASPSSTHDPNSTVTPTGSANVSTTATQSPSAPPTPTTSGTSWAEQFDTPLQYLQAANGTEGTTAAAGFGESIALSGDGTVLVVGASNATNASGSTFVYVTDSNTASGWSSPICVLAPDALPGDMFGTSVAVSGDGTYLVVGAPGRSQRQGSGYVFVRQGGTHTWLPSYTLNTGSPLTTAAALGMSVAVTPDGTTIVLGGPGGSIGIACVFERRGSLWSEKAVLVSIDGLPSIGFGASVAINPSGTIIAVGSPLMAANYNPGAGCVYLYLLDSVTGWMPAATLKAPDAVAGDAFGTSVALSHNSILIGAPLKRSSAGQTGAGQVFLWQVDPRTGECTLDRVLTGSGSTGPALLGSSVAITTSGTACLIGAPGSTVGGRSSQGVSYLFHLNGRTTAALTRWSMQMSLTNGAAATAFGVAVALSSDAAVAASGTMAGAALAGPIGAATAPVSTNDSGDAWKIGVGVGAGVCIASVCVGVAFYYYRRRTRRPLQPAPGRRVPVIPTTSADATPNSRSRRIMEMTSVSMVNPIHPSTTGR